MKTCRNCEWDGKLYCETKWESGDCWTQRRWVSVLIIAAVSLVVIIGASLICLAIDEARRPPARDVLSRPYGQGAPRSTDYRDDGKPENHRRCVDPRTLFEFFDGFTFSIGRTGQAVYYYQGKRVAVRTERIRIKSEGCATAFDRVRETLVIVEKERELNGWEN